MCIRDRDNADLFSVRFADRIRGCCQSATREAIWKIVLRARLTSFNPVYLHPTFHRLHARSSVDCSEQTRRGTEACSAASQDSAARTRGNVPSRRRSCIPNTVEGRFGEHRAEADGPVADIVDSCHQRFLPFVKRTGSPAKDCQSCGKTRLASSHALAGANPAVFTAPAPALSWR